MKRGQRGRESLGRSRITTLLAWSVCVAGIAALAGTVVLQTARVAGPEESETFFEKVTLILGFSAIIVMGAVVASRRPRNAEGWMFLASGLGVGLVAFTAEYAALAFDAPGGNYPGAVLAAWGEQWLWFPSIALIPSLVLLLFPDGRPPSPHWRWLTWPRGQRLR